jgi:hypothetical protein
MWIHWKRKLLRFSYKGAKIYLKGIKDSLSACPKIKTRKLNGLVRQGGVAQVIHFCPVTENQQQLFIHKKSSSSLILMPAYSKTLTPFLHPGSLINTSH